MASTLFLSASQSNALATLAAAVAWNLTVFTSYNYFYGNLKKGISLDRGKKWNDKRIIGDGRTFSGLHVALLLGATAHLVTQQTLFINAAIGANAGTVINSVIKRRLGIKRGAGDAPTDYFDHTLGALLFTAPVHTINLPLYITGAFLIAATHKAIDTYIRPSFT